MGVILLDATIRTRDDEACLRSMVNRLTRAPRARNINKKLGEDRPDHQEGERNQLQPSSTTIQSMNKSPTYFLILIAIQAIAAVIFTTDAVSDFFIQKELDWHDFVEVVASIAIILAMALETTNLRDLLRRKANLERTLKNASIEVNTVIESKFDQWSFSPSEKDVAGLLVKGLNTAEIAQVRGTAEGTVKAQLHSIYRKAEARSRSDLMSQILDAMIDRPLLNNRDDPSPTAKRTADN